METIRKTRNDLTGRTFGRLTVIGPRKSITDNRGHFRSQWLCQCACGKQLWKQSDALVQGQTESCGCLRIERTVAKISKAHKAAGEANRTHGMSKTSLYRRYAAMLQRCYNPVTREFRWYGGRGITVCARWRESFENFFADMGASYSEGLSLERTNSNGPYSPENCKWIARGKQADNTSRSVYIAPTLTIRTFCDQNLVPYDLVWHTYRLKTLFPEAWGKLMQLIDNQGNYRNIT